MSRNGRILSPPRPAGPHVVRRRFQGILGKRRTLENLADPRRRPTRLHGPEAQRQGHPRPRRQHLHPVGGRPRRARQRGPARRRSCAQLGAEEVADPHRQPRPPAEPQPRRALRHRAPATRTATALRGGLHCMVDTSPPLGMLARPGVDPVKDYFFVADHHADPAEVEENCRAKGVRRVRLPFVGPRRWARPPPSWP